MNSEQERGSKRIGEIKMICRVKRLFSLCVEGKGTGKKNSIQFQFNSLNSGDSGFFCSFNRQPGFAEGGNSLLSLSFATVDSLLKIQGLWRALQAS